MDISNLYASYIARADELLNSWGLRGEVVQNDTLCLQVPSNSRYDEVKTDLHKLGNLISESEINGRLIAVFELHRPLRSHGWSVSFVELPQPKTGAETEGVRHLQFVVRTSIESFRVRFPHLTFDHRGNDLNRLLEIEESGVVVRFHDKNMGSVIAHEVGR